MNGYDRIARKILQVLRESYDTGEIFLGDIEWLRSNLHEGSLTLNSIGTDEEELAKFRICGLKFDAKKYLRHLRDPKISNYGAYESILNGLTDILNEKVFLPVDIGTDAEEIRQFRVRVVRLLLDFARKGSEHPRLITSIVCLRCREERISYSEIGTDEAEINLLMRMQVRG